MKRQLTYLAAPYSHENPSVREARFEAINLAASRLMAYGVHLFSPISHTHPIALAGALPTGWDYWQAYDETMLSVCTSLCVLKLSGWQRSSGVAGEIAIAKRLTIPTYYTDLDAESLADAAHWLKDLCYKPG